MRTIHAGSDGCLVLADIAGAAGPLAFGLDWSPLIGGDPERLARRRARDRRASHFVCGGAPVTVAGSVRLPRLGRRTGPLHAAALAFAGLHADGAAAVVVPLPPHGAWLAAVHRGAVVAGTDRLYPSADRALQAAQDLLRRYPGMSLLGTAGLPPPDLSALAAGATAAAVLRPVGPGRGRRLALAGALTLAAAGAVLGPGRALRDASAPDAAAPLAAARAWDRAVAEYAAGVRVHGSRATARLFAGLASLPVAVRGWSLRQAGCQPAGPAWRCEARYARTGVLAANDALAAAVPAGLRLRFRTLEEAELNWEVDVPAATLERSRLASSHATDLRLGSALQRVRPVFARVSLGESRPAALAAPRDTAGRPLPPPPGMSMPHVRGLELQGPLRSFGVLPYDAAPLSWQSIRLDVVAVRRPGPSSSILMARLKGTLHEAF